jgi:hypothetical protein
MEVEVEMDPEQTPDFSRRPVKVDPQLNLSQSQRLSRNQRRPVKVIL